MHVEVEVGPYCGCRSFRYPHEVSAHRKLRADWDWRTAEEREGGGIYDEDE